MMPPNTTLTKLGQTGVPWNPDILEYKHESLLECSTKAVYNRGEVVPERGYPIPSHRAHPTYWYSKYKEATQQAECDRSLDDWSEKEEEAVLLGKDQCIQRLGHGRH
jgi:hypothetical protein